MFQSMTDGPIWEKEFALLVDQEHFEKVWGIMLRMWSNMPTVF